MHNNSTSDPVRCERQRVMDSPSIKILADYMYHQLMNDVDLHDQLRKKYASVRPSKKYWMFILWFVLDCCRVNAYIVYKEAWSRTIRNKRYTHLDFVIELGGAIIRNFTSRKRVCIRESLAPVFVEYNCVNHVFFLCLDGKRRMCKGCHVFSIRTEVVTGCPTCSILLCKTCYLARHWARKNNCDPKCDWMWWN